MKNVKFTVLVLFAVITFTSCADFKNSLNANKGVNLSSLQLGMTKEEVQTQLKKRPDNIIATKKDPETNKLIEVVQYTDGTQNMHYWMYFVDDKLEKWEKASRDHEPWI